MPKHNIFAALFGSPRPQRPQRAAVVATAQRRVLPAGAALGTALHMSKGAFLCALVVVLQLLGDVALAVAVAHLRRLDDGAGAAGGVSGEQEDDGAGAAGGVSGEQEAAGVYGPSDGGDNSVGSNSKQRPSAITAIARALASGPTTATVQMRRTSMARSARQPRREAPALLG